MINEVGIHVQELHYAAKYKDLQDFILLWMDVQCAATILVQQPP
jgi:hypothetical protein